MPREFFRYDGVTHTPTTNNTLILASYSSSFISTLPLYLQWGKLFYDHTKYLYKSLLCRLLLQLTISLNPYNTVILHVMFNLPASHTKFPKNLPPRANQPNYKIHAANTHQSSFIAHSLLLVRHQKFESYPYSDTQRYFGYLRRSRQTAQK